MSDEAAGSTETGSVDLERVWAEHLDGEFGIKDVEATLATMVDDAYVNHMPVNTGGRGKEELRGSTATCLSHRGRATSR